MIDAGFSPSAARVIAASLSGREIRVVSGDQCSCWRRVDRGVGLGGRLGPVFYTLTANRYPSVLFGGCRCHLLADDATVELATILEELLAAVQLLQSNLDAVQDWSSGVWLVMNPMKIVFVCFGSASSVATARALEPFVEVAGRRIVLSAEVKYLGVCLTETLSWGRQARMLTSRVYNALRSMAHFKRALSPRVRLLLVRSLAAVHLDYCDLVFSGADARTTHMLQVAQNASIRFIDSLPWGSHVSASRRRLGFLTATDKRRYKSLILFHRLIHDGRPSALVDTIRPLSGDDFRRGRATGTRRYVLPRACTGYGSMSFSFRTVRDWNSLPDGLRGITTLPAFKRAL